MWETLIPVAGKAIGTLLDQRTADKNLEFRKQEAEAERQRQLDFAQHGIQWRVEDAQRAGIHPLAALGASVSGSSPISVGDVTRPSMSDTMGSMGQDIGRAIAAGSPQAVRDKMFNNTLQALQLKRAGLENDLIAAKIGQLKSAQVGPALPGVPDKDEFNPSGTDVPIPTKKPSELKRLYLGGVHFPMAPDTSTGEDIEDAMGDEGVPAYVMKNIAQLYHLAHGAGPWMSGVLGQSERAAGAWWRGIPEWWRNRRENWERHYRDRYK